MSTTSPRQDGPSTGLVAAAVLFIAFAAKDLFSEDSPGEWFSRVHQTDNLDNSCGVSDHDATYDDVEFEFEFDVDVDVDVEFDVDVDVDVDVDTSLENILAGTLLDKSVSKAPGAGDGEVCKYTLIVPLEFFIFIRNTQNVKGSAEKMIYKFNHPGCVPLLLFLRLQQGGI